MTVRSSEVGGTPQVLSTDCFARVHFFRSDRSLMRTDGSKAWPAAWCITNQSSASSPLGNSTASLIFAARTFAHADAAEKRKAPQKIPCLKVCQFIKYRLRSCRAYTHLTDMTTSTSFQRISGLLKPTDSASCKPTSDCYAVLRCWDLEKDCLVCQWIWLYFHLKRIGYCKPKEFTAQGLRMVAA